MIGAKKLLSERYRFKKEYIPYRLTQSQMEARNIFLEEIHKKNRYVTITRCPYCGSPNFIKISEIDTKGLPSDIVICDSCDGCFKLNILDKGAARYHYGNLSYVLRGKDTRNAAIEELFQKRVKAFAYSRYFFIRHFVRLNPHEDLIVELGSGDGANLYPWFKNGFEVLGVELDSKMVSFGKKKGLNLIQGDFSDLCLHKKAKLIILSHILEHVENVNHTLKKVREILVPGGYVFIESPGIRLYGLGDPLRYFDVEHNYNFDQRSLSGLLEKHEFAIIYADEYIRILCSPFNNQHFRSDKFIAVFPSFILAILLRAILKIIGLYKPIILDLLNSRVKHRLKMRVYARLLGLYFDCYYSSIKNIEEKNEKEQK